MSDDLLYICSQFGSPITDPCAIVYLARQFGQGGFLSTDISYTLAEDAMGNIVAAGQILDGTNSKIGVARYLYNGILDPSFGAGGKVETNISGSEYPRTVMVQGDGKILIVLNC